ncbi:MAG: TetR/AcrR family transcriptional regulator [Nocardiopsaceae bacterium]|nr:TetR/AcrR family transcriptional regulator [Nocardiopsaceae bacterium]
MGWAGFSMDAVARRAGVGKASLYLRWNSKEALLTDVVRGLATVADADTGTLRGDLVELAVQMLGLYTVPGRLAALRLALEAEVIPSVAEEYNRMKKSQILAARAMVRRGIERGELAPDAPVTVLLDTLSGGALMHILAAPPDRRAELVRDARAYAERLVSFVLRAIGAT